MKELYLLIKARHIKKTSYQVLGLLLALFVVYLVVYLTGGTHAPWPQLNLVVIAGASYYFQMYSFLFASIAAFLMGPMMPLDVKNGVLQLPIDMIGRLAIYLAFSLVFGTFFAHDEKLHKTLIDITSRDSFSGLLNRNIMVSQLQEMIASWNSFYLVIVKIANLDGIGKYVAQEQGKQISDAVIATLKRELGPLDLYATGFGEYSFVIDKRNFKSAISRLDQLVRFSFKNMAVGDYNFNLITKVGVVLHDHGEGNPQKLLNSARVALDQGEEFESGVYYYDNYQAYSNRQSYEVANSLLLALDNREFYLVYQPITNLENRQVECVEALIRWDRKDKEQIGPGVFIEIAEKIGLISRITKWVVIQSVAQLKHWNKIGIDIQVSINITVREIEDDKFVDWLTSYVKGQNILPELIKLEITERVFSANSSKLEEILAKLRLQGFSVSVDDFGTGYNSLLTFAKIPMDSIKIDKYFTDNLENPQIYAMVKAIIDFVHQLEINVIIEGVETKNQIRLLETLAADQVQGYYFSKPLNPYELQEYYFQAKNRNH